MNELLDRLNKHSFVDVYSGCFVWIGATNKHGYGKLRIGKGDSRSLLPAHRAAWIVEHGQIPSGSCVCHKCDNPACVNPNHLFLGTHADNMRDKMDKGRGGQLKGSSVPTSILKEKDVVEIRMMLKVGVRHETIARAFGVSYGAIACIKNGQNWKHVCAQVCVQTPESQ